MIKIFYLIILLFPFLLSAKTFTSLSSESGVEITYNATKTERLDVNLLLQVEDLTLDTVPLVLEIEIGEDRVFKYFNVHEAYRNTVKSLVVHGGEEVRISLKLNGENTEINGVTGNLTSSTSFIEFDAADDTNHVFIGDVWAKDEKALYRIEKKGSENQQINFHVYATDNYLMDKLFLRLKVISPKDGVQKLSKTVLINESETVSYDKGVRRFSFTVDEISILSEGNYYFELSHQHQRNRVNGIQAISYDLMTK